MTEVLDRPTPRPAAARHELNRGQMTSFARGYADNLTRQIQEQIEGVGLTSFEEFEQGVKEDRVPLETAHQMEPLVLKLKELIDTGTLSEVPEVEYLPLLDSVVEDWNNKIGRAGFPIQTLSEYDYIFSKISELPRFEPRRFIEDPGTLQRLLDYVYPKLGGNQAGSSAVTSAGLFLSAVYNHAFTKLHPTEVSQIHQEIDAGPYPNIQALGFKFPGGHLDIKGEAGDLIGPYMTEGTITAERVGDYAAHEMKGGRFEADNAKDYLGYKMEDGKVEALIAGKEAGKGMKGGEMVIDRAGDSLGKEMEGGKIIARKVKNWAGEKMKKGHIIITEEAGDELGYGAKGGEIEAEKADDGAGSHNNGAVIRINEAGIDLGLKMMAGEIYAQKAGDFAGADMFGGSLVIEEAKNAVGYRSAGGKIIVRNCEEDLGFKMDGGNIEVLGQFESLGDPIYNGRITHNGVIVHKENKLKFWRHERSDTEVRKKYD